MAIALESIVCDTVIDLYPSGTAALYGHFRREEEEMMLREERERNQREIGAAVWAVQQEGYGAPGGSDISSQWSVDIPEGTTGYEGTVWDIKAARAEEQV